MDDRELGLAAAGDDRHHASPTSKRCTPGPHSTTSPASSRPGCPAARRRGRVAALQLMHVGAVEPGAADAHEQVGVPGDRIGVLLDGDRAVPDRGRAHGRRSYRLVIRPVRAPGWCIYAGRHVLFRVRTPGQYVPSPCTTAHSAHVAGDANRPRGRRAAPQPGLPRPRAAGGRAPPGAADPGLHGRRRVARDDGELAAPAGYCTHRTGIRANFDCSEEACRRLEARLEHMADRHGERVVVIGQSRGGSSPARSAPGGRSSSRGS